MPPADGPPPTPEVGVSPGVSPPPRPHPSPHPPSTPSSTPGHRPGGAARPRHLPWGAAWGRGPGRGRGEPRAEGGGGVGGGPDRAGGGAGPVGDARGRAGAGAAAARDAPHPPGCWVLSASRQRGGTPGTAPPPPPRWTPGTGGGGVAGWSPAFPSPGTGDGGWVSSSASPRFLPHVVLRDSVSPVAPQRGWGGAGGGALEGRAAPRGPWGEEANRGLGEGGRDGTGGTLGWRSSAKEGTGGRSAGGGTERGWGWVQGDAQGRGGCSDWPQRPLALPSHSPVPLPLAPSSATEQVGWGAVPPPLCASVSPGHGH